MKWIVALCMSAAALDASVALAQGTAVQLPSVSYFTSSGSVSVPDRGGATLGGVNRSSSGMNEFGGRLLPFGNRSIGSQRGGSGVSVSAYIHDFEAMDEFLLGPGFSPRQPATTNLTSARDVPPPSVKELLAERRRDQEARQTEALELVKRAQSAEEAGKPNVAGTYYRMASRKASGSLKEQIFAKLESLRSK
jgi:hypothetical protein